MEFELFSAENFKFTVDADTDDVVDVVDEEDDEVDALKHFWHILLVAGFPVTPQLLTQRVMVS